MAFKSVQSLDADTAVSLGGQNKKTGKKNPTSVEGYFLGTKVVNSPKSKNGKANLYILQTAEGNVGVYGKTDLDNKMNSVNPGTMVRLSNTGQTRPTKNGDMQVFKVEVDDENTIEVAISTAPKAAVVGGDDDEEPSYGESSDADDEIDGYEVEERRQTVALSAAERQAKVQALLKKKK